MSKSTFSASSFVTEVLTTAGQSEKDDIDAKLTKITKKIDEVKVEVYESLHKKYDEFYPDLKTAIQLNDRVQALSTEMDDMAVKIEKEIKTKLQSSTSEFQDLSEQFKEANTRQAILEKIVCIHENLEAIDKDLLKNDYVGATNRLEVIDTRLKEPANEREKEVKVLTVLESQYVLQQEKLKQDINTAWSNHISWVIPDERETSENETNSVRLRIDNSEQSMKVLKSIIQALYNVNMLDQKLKSFSDRVYKYILQPIVNRAVALSENKPTEVTEIVASYSAKKSDLPMLPKDVFDKVNKVLVFLQENLFKIEITTDQDENLAVMSLLGDVLSVKLQEEIINECLAPSVPTNQKELDGYKEVISDTESFHRELIQVKFIEAKDSTLLDFVNNINVLFANKKCKEILEKARNLMTTELHNMVKVSENHPFGELPPLDFGGGGKKGKASESLVLPANMKLSPNIFKMPSYCVSMHAEALMELAYETLVEATQSSQSCAIQLFYAVRNMFELYCSVVPTYHKESIATLPQLSALQHNNCMYLAHHLLTLGHQYKAKLPPPLSQGAATFIDLVPCLRRIGTECFLNQLSQQRDQLLDILKQTNGFASVADGENSLIAERTMKQIMYQLEHLAKIWRPVLPQNIYAKSIGTLMNSVLVEIMTSVTSLEDISADDATKLHAVMTILIKRGPSLFSMTTDDIASSENESNSTGAESSPVLIHQFVRKWLKFEEIMLLLNANLQGISDRWADGKGPLAAECNASEVKQMIRALFQNTDRRAAVLARIK